MQKIILGLEEIARSVKNSGEISKTAQALEAARDAIRTSKARSGRETAVLLEKLDKELETWQAKLPVIIKEPAGRQGMAKHAHYWVEELNKTEGL